MLDFIDRMAMWAMEQGITFALKWIERFSRWLDGEPFWGPSPSGLKLGEFNNIFALLDRLPTGELLFVQWNNQTLAIRPEDIKEVVDLAPYYNEPRQVWLEAYNGNLYGLNMAWWDGLIERSSLESYVVSSTKVEDEC